MGDYFEGQSQATTHHGDVELDPNILACLPQNCRVISCKGHGASNWNQTARLDIETTGDDGTQRRESYFLKLVTGPNGRGMVHGEYESMFLIHETIPKFAARPLAWGACTEPDKHYILFSFHELAPGLPDVDNFAHAVSQLHSLTSGASPNGKFGFHVTTFNGTLPQDNTWTDTWEEFYIRGMRRMFQLEEKAHGPSEELSALVRPFLEVVIPRLLRPMETAGRCIKPVLIHGDLWIDELSTMRPLNNEWGRACLESYHNEVPKSEPQEDWDARNALYATRTYIHDSALYPQVPKFRQLLIEEMRKRSQQM